MSKPQPVQPMSEQAGLPTQTKSGAPMPALISGGRVAAIVPENIDQAWRIAGFIAASGTAPKGYGSDANKIVVGILHGLEVGFTPFAALQSIAVINGMPSIWGDGALALIQRSGLLVDIEETLQGEGEAMVAVCRMQRKDRKSVIERKFSVGDAKKANLWGKDGPWKTYPQRMLQMRARSWTMRDGFADVLRGLSIREEVEDIPVQNLQRGADGTYTPTENAPPRPQRSDFVQPQPQANSDSWGEDWPLTDEVGVIVGEYRRADQWLDALENAAKGLTGATLHTLLDNNAEIAAKISEGYDGRYKDRLAQLYVERSAGLPQRDANGNDPGAAASQADAGEGQSEGQGDAAEERASWLVSREAFPTLGKFQAEMLRLVADVALNADDLAALEADNEERMAEFEAQPGNAAPIKLVRQMLKQQKAHFEKQAQK